VSFRLEVPVSESKPRVVTAAELDAMSPAERQQHFEDSIVPPSDLTPEQRERVLARQEQHIAERRQRAS
jgi:hypothetical protein